MNKPSTPTLPLPERIITPSSGISSPPIDCPHEMALPLTRKATHQPTYYLTNQILEMSHKRNGGAGGPIECPPGVGANGHTSRSDRHPEE